MPWLVELSCLNRSRQDQIPGEKVLTEAEILSKLSHPIPGMMNSECFQQSPAVVFAQERPEV